MSSEPEREPLPVGMQVRAVDSEPVFSSDPSTGDVGKVIEVAPTGGLVRWQSGAETWMQRKHLAPVSRVGPLPLASGELPVPMAALGRRGVLIRRYASTIVFLAVFAWIWSPSIAGDLRHPTLQSGIATAGLIVALVAFGVRAIRSVPADQQAAEDAKAARATSAERTLPPR